MTLDPRLERAETLAGGRVQLRSIGQLQHPGCCALCRSGNCDEGYVDLDTFFDYEGQVYLCMNCTNEVIAAVGGFNDELANVARERLKQYATIVEELSTRLEAANERLANYDSLFNSVMATNADVVSAAVSVSEAVHENPLDATDAADEGEPESEEPVASERRRKPSRATGSNADGTGFTV